MQQVVADAATKLDVSHIEMNVSRVTAKVDEIEERGRHRDMGGACYCLCACVSVRVSLCVCIRVYTPTYILIQTHTHTQFARELCAESWLWILSFANHTCMCVYIYTYIRRPSLTLTHESWLWIGSFATQSTLSADREQVQKKICCKQKAPPCNARGLLQTKADHKTPHPHG